MVHNLKILYGRYLDIKHGLKKFEIRYNDRNYKIGDTLVLNPFCEINKNLEVPSLSVQVTYIDDYEQKKGFLVLGIKRF